MSVFGVMPPSFLPLYWLIPFYESKEPEPHGQVCHKKIIRGKKQAPANPLVLEKISNKDYKVHCKLGK